MGDPAVLAVEADEAGLASWMVLFHPLSPYYPEQNA